jgi:hypothetical protein
MEVTIIGPRHVERPGSRLIVERLLRDRDAIWRQVKGEHALNGLIREMLLTSAVALFCYGAIMGVFGGPLQALSGAIKLPLLYLLTLAICLPTLYLFNLLYGGRLSVRQVLALSLAGITVMAALTLAFAPISLFFLLTARDYEFFKLLNVAILGLTGLTGLNFLVGGMRAMNASEPAITLADAATEETAAAPAAKPARAASMPFLQIWLFLFAFVGTQLGWTLRPFFGSPGLSFEIFRTLEGNFYMNMVQTVLQLLRMVR